MSRGWESAYEHQMSTWEFWGSDAGRGFALGFTKNAGFKMWRAEWLQQVTRTALWLGEPIAVESDMQTLIEHAAQSFEPEPLRETDLITATGFMWMPRPMFLVDRHGKRMAYRAVSWMPGIYRSLAGEFDADLPLEEKIAAAGNAFDADDKVPDGTPGLFVCLYSYRYDADDYDDQNALMRTFPNDLTLAHFTFWPFGYAYNGRDDNPEYGLKPIGRQLQTAFRIMQQTIATSHEERPPRAARRRAQRAEFPDKRVTVIYLRRPKQPTPEGHEPKEVEWSHRWLVGGHWRNQWFPSLGQHRQIWISPYIKGPDDAPLKIRRLRAFELKH